MSNVVDIATARDKRDGPFGVYWVFCRQCGDIHVACAPTSIDPEHMQCARCGKLDSVAITEEAAERVVKRPEHSAECLCNRCDADGSRKAAVR